MTNREILDHLKRYVGEIRRSSRVLVEKIMEWERTIEEIEQRMTPVGNESGLLFYAPLTESSSGEATKEPGAPEGVKQCCPQCGYPDHAIGGPFKGIYNPHQACDNCGFDYDR